MWDRHHHITAFPSKSEIHWNCFSLQLLVQLHNPPPMISNDVMFTVIQKLIGEHVKKKEILHLFVLLTVIMQMFDINIYGSVYLHLLHISVDLNPSTFKLNFTQIF